MVLDCKKILKLYQFWNLLGLRVLPCAATLLHERNWKSYYDIATIEKNDSAATAPALLFLDASVTFS